MVREMNDRALATVNQGDWQLMLDQAKVLVPTGFLPDAIKTPEQAVAVMLKGRELGIPPMYALSNIVVIKGKPTASAELMLALVYRDHGDGAVMIEESTNERCALSYKRRSWDKRRAFTFTVDDAKRAQLLNNPTWQKFPAAMLRARAISAVARMAFPDSIGGMYTPEELGASVEVTGDGEVIVSDAAPEPMPEQDAEFREIESPPRMTDDQFQAIRRRANTWLINWPDVVSYSGRMFGGRQPYELTFEEGKRLVHWMELQRKGEKQGDDQPAQQPQAALPIEPDAPAFDPDTDADLMDIE